MDQVFVTKKLLWHHLRERTEYICEYPPQSAAGMLTQKRIRRNHEIPHCQQLFFAHPARGNLASNFVRPSHPQQTGESSASAPPIRRMHASSEEMDVRKAPIW
jgi:hypothetical protein